MLKIREIAARNAKTSPDGNPQWERVQREAARSGSPFKDELEGLCTFVRELSGGLVNPVLLFELRDFGKQLQTVRVAVPMSSINSRLSRSARRAPSLCSGTLA